eukprot:6785252-Pyramimonas_sp.AAC.1
MKVRQARFRRVRMAGPLLCEFAKQAIPAASTHGVGVPGAPPSLVHAMRRDRSRRFSRSSNVDTVIRARFGPRG